MKVVCEGFSESQQRIVVADFDRLAKTLIPKTTAERTPVAKWFGASDRVKLLAYLTKLRNVVNSDSRTVTFVNRTGGVLRVEYKSLYEPRLLGPKEKPFKLDDVAGAYAFPVDRRDEGDIEGLDTLSHVGSGMRIYLCKSYFDEGDATRSSIMYHELTHKVIATEDYGYGADFCSALAGSPEKAIKNADNYAYFLLDC
jgi:hypothetical protein